ESRVLHQRVANIFARNAAAIFTLAQHAIWQIKRNFQVVAAQKIFHDAFRVLETLIFHSANSFGTGLVTDLSSKILQVACHAVAAFDESRPKSGDLRSEW